MLCRQWLLCTWAVGIVSAVYDDSSRVSASTPLTSCPEASCEGRCGEIASGRHRCSCDERCRVLGDCCLDADMVCFHSGEGQLQALMPSKADKEAATIIRKSLECVELNVTVETQSHEVLPRDSVSRLSHSVAVTKQAFMMISSCPEGHPDAGLCLETQRSPRHAIPVYAPEAHLLFRNYYCAECHGHSFYILMARAFVIKLPQCDNSSMTALENITAPLNGTVVGVLWDKCDSYAFSVDSEFKEKIERLSCFNEPTEMIKHNGPYRYCEAYSNPVTTADRKLVYKNWFCAPEDLKQDLFCYDKSERNNPISGYLQPKFQVSFNFCGMPVVRKVEGVTAVPAPTEYDNDYDNRRTNLRLQPEQGPQNSPTKHAYISHAHTVSPIKCVHAFVLFGLVMIVFGGFVWFNTRWPPFCRQYSKIHFHQWKSLDIDSNFTKICSLGSNWSHLSIIQLYKVFINETSNWKKS